MIFPTKMLRLSEILHQYAGVAALADLLDSLLADLPYAFSRQSHLRADLLQSLLVASDTEALRHDLSLIHI